MKDVVARSYYPLYKLATETYWQAYDQLQALLRQKAFLVERYDPRAGVSASLDETFRPSARLRVTLALAGRVVRGGASELTVVVGGKQAVREGGAYVVDARDVEEGPGGAVRLEVSSRP